MSKFKITSKPKSMNEPNTSIGSGFQLTFSNGNTISVQFGFGSYCEQKHETTGESVDAEIAIWNTEGKWYNFGSDEVNGYCPADEVADWIHFAKTQTI